MFMACHRYIIFTRTSFEVGDTSLSQSVGPEVELLHRTDGLSEEYAVLIFCVSRVIDGPIHLALVSRHDNFTASCSLKRRGNQVACETRPCWRLFAAAG